jgi:hypothetical protein
MTLEELLAIDLRSHPGRYDIYDSLAEIEGKMQDGWHGFRAGNTFILNKRDKNGYLEFHCYNAERGDQLAKNVKTLLDNARDAGFEIAWTPYQNSKINELFKTIVAEDYLHIEEIQDGYLAKVRL